MQQMLGALVATTVLLTAVAAQSSVTEADYVVVGGGTAGCALAARLCEGLPDSKVVLLERGTPRSEQQELDVRSIRRMFVNLADPDIVEAWVTEPNAGLNGATFSVLAGKTLGGTSAINGLQFSRPEAKVPASWGLTGLDEATADRLYAKVMDQTQASPQPEELKMTYLPDWLEANVMAGNPIIADPKGEPVDGVWEANALADDVGRRHDSAYAYLRPAMEGVCGGNLEVIQEATASRVVIEGGTAVGVEYLVGDSSLSEVVIANKEVLLSAGTFASPKILMLSGIGPAEVLEEFGVLVLADLPVGEDAHARAFTSLSYTYTGMPVPPEAQPEILESEEALEQFNAGLGGVLAVNPNMANGVYGPPIGAFRSGLMVQLLSSEVSLPGNMGGAACVLNTDKRSRATVRLNSTDVTDPPTVDTNIMAQEEEIKRMVMCIEREREYFANLVELGFNITEISPSADTNLEDFVRESTLNAWHFVGSCGIGKVLDQDLKVIGFDNLRVVDASAIPDMTQNAGPAGTTFMLAEYAAERIIAEDGGPVGGVTAPSGGVYGTKNEGAYGGYP